MSSLSGQNSLPNSNRRKPVINHVAPESSVSSVATPITKTTQYLEQLKALAHCNETLAAAGYVVEKLSDEALELKKRCSGCGRSMSRFVPKKRRQQNRNGENLGHARNDSLSPVNTTVDDIPSNREPRMRCKFHSGKLKNTIWSCCGGRTMNSPCTEREFHLPKLYALGEIEKLWHYHKTTGGQTPFHRSAVAIDCEMGMAESGGSELIRVTLLDYFSGKVLIDRLVWPSVPMLHFNTRYSGVSRGDMNNARRSRTCFYGRDSARSAILKLVGPDTVVVGHSAHNDLTALRWIHPKIVDTYILESINNDKRVEETNPPLDSKLESLNISDVKANDNADCGQKRPKGSGPLSLKTLSKAKLGREIQVGRNGHDSIEDALAARDLIHAYISSKTATK